MFRIVVSSEVAKLGPNGSGSRRCYLSGEGEEPFLVTFSRRPTFCDKLPGEVKSDPHLLCEKVTPKAALGEGGQVLHLEGGGVCLEFPAGAKTLPKLPKVES